MRNFELSSRTILLTLCFGMMSAPAPSVLAGEPLGLAPAPNPEPLPTQLKLEPLFADHMVLQRDVAANIWGQAVPGASVTIRVTGIHGPAQVAATSDGAGNWRAELPPQTAGGPCEIRITGDTTVTLHDVYFGDVWLMSGQSNMDHTCKGILKPEVLATESAAANDPQLRFFTVNKNPLPEPTRHLSGQMRLSGWMPKSTVETFWLRAVWFPRPPLSATVGRTIPSATSRTAPACPPPLFGRLPLNPLLVNPERARSATEIGAQERPKSVRNPIPAPKFSVLREITK